MKYFILLLALVSFNTPAEPLDPAKQPRLKMVYTDKRTDERKKFDTRARLSRKANDGKLMFIPKTPIICVTREKGIEIHNYVIKNYNGQYNGRLIEQLTDSCHMSHSISAGFIIETVAGSSFVKMEYTPNRAITAEGWFYLPAIKSWKSHKENRLK